MLLSARDWKLRFVPWHALVFWVWMASFVFSFAANDAFHAPDCPDQMALQCARANPNAPVTPALWQNSDLAASSHHLDCAACAFQSAFAAVLLVIALIFGARVVIAPLNGSAPVRTLVRGLTFEARGPPVWVSTSILL